MIYSDLNNETLRLYCLSKPYATEDLPFDDTTLVFRLSGKIFALLPLDSPTPCISLKCNPDRAIELRDRYSAVMPAYHMNKTHWNMILTNSNVPKALVIELIDHSYDLVFKSLSLKKQDELRQR